ncbi:hypothetical protein [Nesterenkonia rhizosphaerae]|uniref:Tetratricopeptide repeat protein n=1 Tax=Nesterenkonia rhizosphaerae TaxID=1348272 RepID=A0ABP9FSU4_9MICC
MQPEHVDPDLLIEQINTEELYRRRLVWGRDLNDWHLTLDHWISTGLTAKALELLELILETVETLEQFDTREPQFYWYKMTAELYLSTGEPDKAADTLERWVAGWPDSRAVPDQARASLERTKTQITTKVAKLRKSA